MVALGVDYCVIDMDVLPVDAVGVNVLLGGGTRILSLGACNLPNTKAKIQVAPCLHEPMRLNLNPEP